MIGYAQTTCPLIVLQGIRLSLTWPLAAAALWIMQNEVMAKRFKDSRRVHCLIYGVFFVGI